MSRTRELRSPSWLHWPTVMGVLPLTAAVVGETVDAEHQALAWAVRDAEGQAHAVRAEVTPGSGSVRVTTLAGDDEVADDLVRWRLHLDLGTSELRDALTRADHVALPPDAPPYRLPSATSPWAFCLTYLSGGSAAHEVTQRLFSEGETVGDLRLPPRPHELAARSQDELERMGLLPRRAEALREVAATFADRPEMEDRTHLASLPAEEAVAEVRALPRLGRTRAPLLAALAWGHHDVGYDPYSPAGAKQEGRAHERQLHDAFERAAPLRSVLADSILVDLLG